jgi:hypothetical protein
LRPSIGQRARFCKGGSRVRGYCRRCFGRYFPKESNHLEVTMVTIWLGALLFIVGLVYLASQSIWRGRLSNPHPATPGPLRTLEPDRRGLRFLGLQQNWPGLAVMAIGLLLLFWGAIV